MSKGSTQAGTITKTDTNVATPYLAGGYESARNLFDNNKLQYTPGPTLATAGSQEQLRGYENLYNQGVNFQGQIAQPTTDAYGNLIAGAAGVQNSPAYAGMQQYAQGASGPQQSLADIQQAARNGGYQYSDAVANYAGPAYGYGLQAAAGNAGLNSLMSTAQGGGPGMQQLAAAASGQYLNSNPYSAAAFQSQVADPMVRNYMTAVAPGIDASASQSGRYGSGAHGGMVDTSQQNLARGLGNAANEWGSAQYGRERQLQDAAASQYASQGTAAGQAGGGLYNQGLGLGITGAQAAGGLQGAAGNQYFAGLSQADQAAAQRAAMQQYGLSGLQGGYQAGQNTAVNALQQFPNIANAQFTGARAMTEGGTGVRSLEQQQIDDANKRFYGIQQAPYNTQQAYMGNFAGVSPGGTSSQPIMRTRAPIC